MLDIIYILIFTLTGGSIAVAEIRLRNYDAARQIEASNATIRDATLTVQSRRADYLRSFMTPEDVSHFQKNAWSPPKQLLALTAPPPAQRPPSASHYTRQPIRYTYRTNTNTIIRDASGRTIYVLEEDM